MSKARRRRKPRPAITPASHEGFACANSAPAADLGELPTVLNGRYRLERLLGIGGMGSVYRARDLLWEQFGEPSPWVAVKLLNEEFATIPDASALLYSEYALAVRLRHPAIVRLHAFEVDTACRRAFITQELLKGLPLDHLLCDRPTGLPWLELREIAVPLLGAVAHAHRCGVVHGDLKPSNVILTDAGPRLFDFGLAHADSGLPTLARERIGAWTPRYAALELLDGDRPSPASDLYALACVLYELATGRHPYGRLDARQALEQHCHRRLEAPGVLPLGAWRALRAALAPTATARCIGLEELEAAFRRRGSLLPEWIRCPLARI